MKITAPPTNIFVGERSFSKLLGQNTRNKIHSFANLIEGWHFGSGGPLNSSTVDNAIRLLDYLLLKGFLETDAFAGDDRSIEVTAYHTDLSGHMHFIGVTIEPTAEYSFAYDIDGQNNRFDEALNADQIRSIINDISGTLWSASGIYTLRISIPELVVLVPLPSRPQGMDAFQLWPTNALNKVPYLNVDMPQLSIIAA